MQLKDQIRVAREATGLSQEDLAERLGVSKQSVIFWELGKGPKLQRIPELELVLETQLKISGMKMHNDFVEDLTVAEADILVKIKQLPKLQRDMVINMIDTLSFSNQPIKPFVNITVKDKKLYKPHLKQTSPIGEKLGAYNVKNVKNFTSITAGGNKQ